ncbi:MAG: hypothetical protein ACOYML_10755 [Microthrixaceae bacterium]
MRNGRTSRRIALGSLLSVVVVATVACGPTNGNGSPSTTTPTSSTTVVTSTTTPGPTTIPSGDVVLSENPVAGVPSGGTKSITVSWNNQKPRTLIFVDICRRPTTDVGFEPGEDCAPLSSQNPNGTASGSGSYPVEIFRGPEPSTDLPWGCFAAGDTAPAGVEKNTTCYVRVTNNTLFNNDQARETAFTLAG